MTRDEPATISSSPLTKMHSLPPECVACRCTVRASALAEAASRGPLPSHALSINCLTLRFVGLACCAHDRYHHRSRARTQLTHQRGRGTFGGLPVRDAKSSTAGRFASAAGASDSICSHTWINIAHAPSRSARLGAYPRSPNVTADSERGSTQDQRRVRIEAHSDTKFLAWTDARGRVDRYAQLGRHTNYVRSSFDSMAAGLFSRRARA